MTEPRCWISSPPGREPHRAICVSGLPMEAYHGIATFAAERQHVFGSTLMQRIGDDPPYLEVIVRESRMAEAISLIQPLFERFGLRPPSPIDNPFLTATEIEQMRGSLTPRRFLEEYEGAFDSLYPSVEPSRGSDRVEVPRQEVRVNISLDRQAIDRAFRLIDEDCRQLRQVLEGRTPELRQQIDEIQGRSGRLNADIVRAIVTGWATSRPMHRPMTMQPQKLVRRKALHSCECCDYLMRGYRPDEPHICNAFHQVEDIHAENDCPDWE